MQVIVEIPDEFAALLAREGKDLARTFLEDCTAQAFREDRVTSFEVRCILGLSSRMDVDPFLSKYEISAYTPEMLKEDVEHVKSFFGRTPKSTE